MRGGQERLGGAGGGAALWEGACCKKKEKKKKEEKNLYKDIIFVLHQNYSCMTAIKLHTESPARSDPVGMGGPGPRMAWGHVWEGAVGVGLQQSSREGPYGDL